jgi:hypothetical protein
MSTLPRFRLALLSLLLASPLGCAAARATFNPSAGWAMTEPTPMSVVVHRSRVAADVTGHTDRMLRTLPTTEAAASALMMDEAEARAKLQLAGSHAAYAALPLRVVPAEAWRLKLSSACTQSDADAGIIAALGSEVLEAFERLDALARSIARTKAELAVTRRDARTADGEDKAQHKARATELKQTLAEDKEALRPLLEDALAKIETASSALDVETKHDLSKVTFNLLAAVKDAESANAAALLRYPMAFPKLTDDLQRAVGRFAADVIEEQTGQRPDTGNLQIKVGLEGTKLKLEIAGVDESGLGKLDAAELIRETTRRSQAYVVEIFTLPARLNETAERLWFQRRVLQAVASGLEHPTEGVTTISRIKITAASASDEPTVAPPAGACDSPSDPPSDPPSNEDDELAEIVILDDPPSPVALASTPHP